MATVLKTSALKSLNGNERSSVRINSLIASLDEQILILQTIADRNRASALANVTKDKIEVGAVVHKISDLLDVFLIDTCISTETIGVESFNMTSKAYLKDELKPVYEAFYTADGPVPRRLCTPKTRAEVLSAMICWATSPDDRRIYCLSGMAGTGKTTIVNTLCRILERSRLLGGSFFCSRADTHCSSANRIIPSIVYQLAIRFPSFRSHIIKILENMEEASVERSFRHLVVEPLKACGPEIGGPNIVVIDALDECGNENHVATLLSNLWAHAPTLHVKFLLTFRPDRVFQSRLRLSDSSSTKFHLHDVEESLVERDIRLFLEEHLRHLADDQRARGIEVDPSWPAEAELTALHDQAGKLFIYAATTCEYIGSEGDVTERLSQVIQMGRNPTRLQISPIDGLYTSILDEATRLLEQTEKDRLLQILSAIIYAQKSLTVQSLAALLSFRVQEVLVSLTRLHSVLHFRTHDNDTVVSTLHASFPDYLGDLERSRGYFCDVARGNTMLTRACLTIMETLQENICELTEDSIPGHIDPRRIPESLQYACQFWPTHYHASDFNGSLVDKLTGFFDTHVLHWVECLSLLDVLYPSIAALQNLETGVFRTDRNVQSILRDARRFIAQNIDLLKRNPLETYKSALVWLPTESLIRRKYFSPLTLPKISSGLPKYWDSCEMVLTGHSDGIRSVAFSPDSSRIISRSSNTIRVRNATTGESEHELIAHPNWITSVTLSPDGSRIVSGSFNTVQVWNTTTGESDYVLLGHSDSVLSVAFSPDGFHIASGSSDNTVRVWNSETGELQHELKGHSNRVTSVNFSPDSTRIVSGSDDNTVRVWNSETGESEYELTGHSHSVTSVVFSPDGSCIASGSSDATIRVWNLETGELKYDLTGHSRFIPSIVFSPDGSRISSGSSDTIRVWNSLTGELEHKLAGHSYEIMSVTFSPDGSYIISGSDDNTIRVWNSETGESEYELTGHSHSVTSVVFSPDSARIVSGSTDNTVRVWNSATKESQEELIGHSNRINSLAFSSDGSRIASGSDDHTVRVWNTASGESEYVLIGHSDSVMSVAFSPDGTRIASGSSDTTIRIWDAAAGVLEQELTGHSHWIKSVTFSPNGSHIVSCSFDHKVRVWDMATGESEVLSTSIVLPDQTVIHSQPRGQYLMIRNDESITPRTMFSISEDKQWLIISSKQSRYWIPPRYSHLSSFKFFDNMAAFAYKSGQLIILTVDKQSFICSPT